jgi:RNA polymerase sigma factor (sigma-70 family)
MNFEDEQWNIAEQQFILWLDGKKNGENLTIIDILKSTYLVFRKKQRVRLETICKKSFDYFQKKAKEEEERRLAKPFDFKVANINFALREPEPGYWERLTKEKNEVIINGILSGKQQIFNDLYENEFPKVVRLITKNSGNIDSAKDVFQDALVILIEKVNRMELNLTCPIKTYLYSICRILWLEQLRKDKKTISLNDSYDHYETDIVIVRHDDVPDIYDNVNDAIEKLGNHCQQLLDCYYYKKMSWDEIAKTLGYKNAASAKNQKHKYLEKIRSTVSYEVE